jgi:hypothetical protein
MASSSEEKILFDRFVVGLSRISPFREINIIQIQAAKLATAHTSLLAIASRWPARYSGPLRPQAIAHGVQEGLQQEGKLWLAVRRYLMEPPLRSRLLGIGILNFSCINWQPTQFWEGIGAKVL